MTRAVRGPPPPAPSHRLADARRQTHMASMWRRTMVYLGLQDDDELDYGGEYESYGDYGDPRRRRREPATPTTATTTPTARDARRSAGTGAGRPRAPARCVRAPTTAPEPDPAAAAAARDEPSRMSHAAPVGRAHHRPDHRGPRARGRAAGLQRRPGGRRPPQGEPAGDPQPAGPAAASCSGA